MAMIERVEMQSEQPLFRSASDSYSAGLRIDIRSTSSSLSDYAEWDVESLKNQKDLITDGSCS